MLHYSTATSSPPHTFFASALQHSFVVCGERCSADDFGKQFYIYVMAQHSVIQIGIQKDLNFDAFQEQPSKFQWENVGVQNEPMLLGTTHKSM